MSKNPSNTISGTSISELIEKEQAQEKEEVLKKITRRDIADSINRFHEKVSENPELFEKFYENQQQLNEYYQSKLSIEESQREMRSFQQKIEHEKWLKSQGKNPSKSNVRS